MSLERPAPGWYLCWVHNWDAGPGFNFSLLEWSVSWIPDTAKHPSPIMRSQFLMTMGVLGLGFSLEYLGPDRLPPLTVS